MKPAFPFRRDFVLMVIGQIISLFGNAILRFALSLYVLTLTGSPAVFGGIMAIAMIPTVLLSPIGGVLADRLPRQRIMVVLDFSTCALILLYNFFFAASGALTVITVFLVLLALIQAVYQPAVQASLPSLVDGEHLMSANGIVLQVQALATLLGPVLGGILYAAFGLRPILAASALCFFLSAVMELFIRIPFVPLERTASALKQVFRDLGEAGRFLSREKPRLLKLLIIVAGINLFLSSLFIIGIPYLIKIHLALSDQLYGFAEASLGLGTILGGLSAGLVAHRLGIERSYRFMMATTLLHLPIALVLFLGAAPLVSYGVILLCIVLGMAFAALFNITAQTFLQQQTPSALLGKVGAFVTTISTCAIPLGQAMYGGLFELFQGVPWVVVLFGTATTLVLTLCIRSALKGASEQA